MLMLLHLLAGCTGALPGDDFFYFRSEGADMPVWVRGQLDGGTFVIYLQGGPGNPTSVVDAMFPELTPALDDRYAMVYWDQRGSGVSLGDAAPETLTAEQFAEDLDLLVDILHERYDIDSLFLWGISWGGTLGNTYLLDADRAARIDGWIEMAGGDNMPLAYELSKPQIEDFAQSQIQAGERVGYWEEALEWYAANAVLPPPPENVQHFNYVYDAGGYFYDPDDAFDSFLPYLFSGPMGMTYFSNQAYVDTNMDVDTIDLHPEMGRITTSSLLIWGRQDLVVPVEVGERSYEALGTPDVDKTLLILEGAAHTLPLEAPDACLDAMEEFIDTHR